MRKWFRDWDWVDWVLAIALVAVIGWCLGGLAADLHHAISTGELPR